jgi:hypothetical protein
MTKKLINAAANLIYTTVQVVLLRGHSGSIQDDPCGINGGHSGTRAYYLQVLFFLLSI